MLSDKSTRDSQSSFPGCQHTRTHKEATTTKLEAGILSFLVSQHGKEVVLIEKRLTHHRKDFVSAEKRLSQWRKEVVLAEKRFY